MSLAPRPTTLAAIVMAGGALLAGCAPAPAHSPAPSAPSEPPTRNIVFPLAVSVKYNDTFGAARSGGRAHEGQDLMAPKGTVAVAAAAGTITMVRYSSDGLSGNMLRITDFDGWQYVYIHINNDTPGTDDGANVYEQAFVDGMRQGQKVLAGEPVAYVGDSGNAETTGSHLHFELHQPDGTAVNAYSSLRAATVAPMSWGEVEAAAPTGAVDAISATGGGVVRAAGWALDRVTNSAVPVSTYVDGVPKITAEATGQRPDLEAVFPGRGTAHGYDISLGSVAPGTHRICVIAHNAGDGGGSARLGCSTITVT